MRWIVALATVAIAAGAARADDLDIHGLEAADLRGDALVWEDAVFFAEPWDGGLSFKLSTLSRGRSEEVGKAIPVRIVSSQMRAFVEIELPGRTDCVWRKWQPDPRVEALRLYVKREDLAPVLVKAFAASYPDGTRIKLAPGVAVVPTTSGDYTVALQGDKVTLPIPHGSVGYIYAAGRVAEPELPPGKLVRVDRGATVRLGGDELSPRALWRSAEPPRKTDPMLLRWATRCAELVVSAPSTAVRPIERTLSLSGRGGLSGTARATGYHIPAGAPLSTPGGREIAVAAVAVPVQAPGSSGTGDTSCFEATVAVTKIEDPQSYPPTLTRLLRLCTPSQLVERD